MSILRHLLWPFGLLFNGITALRNWAFSRGHLPAKEYSLPIVSVGNLSTGGTGKTPMIEFLLEFLNMRTAVVSRGYGRKTKGLLEVNKSGTASQFGDEPLQIARKFTDTSVIVSEKRQLGIEHLLRSENPPEVILLDDAYQHRYVKAGFSILLSTYQAPFYNDFILPQGNLRENRKGAQRAQAVVITKCPVDLSKKEMSKIKNAVAEYTQASVYFSSLKYGTLQAVDNAQQPGPKIAVLTGIARPGPLLNELKRNFQVTRHFEFKDHHPFRTSELKEIAEFIKFNKIDLVTTEKDLSRLEEFTDIIPQDKLFVLPVKTAFLGKDGQKLVSQIQAYLKASESL